MPNKVIDRYTEEQRLALNMRRIELYQVRDELWDSIPLEIISVERLIRANKAAPRILAGEVSIEEIKEELRY